MADCQRFETEFLPDLEATGRVQHTHVQDCAECSSSYQSYRRLIAALRSSEAPALQADWQARVLARVRLPAPPPSSSQQPGSGGSRTRRAWYVVAPLAAAAAVLLILVGPGTRLAPLPDYAAALDGGERAMRADSGAPRFRPGAPLEVLLRPEHAVVEAVGARVFVLEHRPRELQIEVVQLTKGVLKLKAATPQPTVAGAQRVTIAVVVGRSGPLAEHAHEWVTLATDSGSDWQRFSIVLELAR